MYCICSSRDAFAANSHMHVIRSAIVRSDLDDDDGMWKRMIEKRMFLSFLFYMSDDNDDLSGPRWLRKSDSMCEHSRTM